MESFDNHRSLTIMEGAWMWHLHPSTLRRAIRRGLLPFLRARGKILIRADDLERFVRGECAGATRDARR
jgi:excisionase family DNA binding protein